MSAPAHPCLSPYPALLPTCCHVPGEAQSEGWTVGRTRRSLPVWSCPLSSSPQPSGLTWPSLPPPGWTTSLTGCPHLPAAAFMSLAPIKMSSAPRLSVSMGPLGAQGPLHLGETGARKRRGLVEDLLAPPALRQGQSGRGGPVLVHRCGGLHPYVWTPSWPTRQSPPHAPAELCPHPLGRLLLTCRGSRVRAGVGTWPYPGAAALVGGAGRPRGGCFSVPNFSSSLAHRYQLFP